MKKRTPWYRDTYTEAVWAPNALRPNEKLVALAYAKYAGSQADPTADVAWVAWSTLSELTGIRSRDALNRAVRGLTEAGWLHQIEAAKQHRSPRYQLTIPDDPDVRNTYAWDNVHNLSDVRLADPSAHGTA